jgi:hypothetical protein
LLYNTLDNSLWIEFKLWLTHCSKIMYSSYDTEIEITIRAHMSVTSRLLLRNVFLTASSHFKSSAFSSVHLKMIRCLVNGFLSVLKLLNISHSSSILSHCTCTEADWSASQCVQFRTSFNLIWATIQGVTWLKVNSSSQLCMY